MDGLKYCRLAFLVAHLLFRMQVLDNIFSFIPGVSSGDDYLRIREKNRPAVRRQSPNERIKRSEADEHDESLLKLLTPADENVMREFNEILQKQIDDLGSQRLQEMRTKHKSFKKSQETTRILGGTVAKTGEIPWQVYLAHWEHLVMCGGSILTAEWFMTAGHCITTFNITNLQGWEITVGILDFRDEVDTMQRRRLQKMIVHPEHLLDNDRYDVALGKLVEKLEWNINVAPIKLAEIEVPAGTACIASGFGDPVDWKLKHITVYITPMSVCHAHQGKIPEMICALEPKDPGKAPCYGDSGGPLACLVGQTIVLSGVACTAGSDDCTTPIGKPAGYMNVAVLYSWLNETINTQ